MHKKLFHAGMVALGLVLFSNSALMSQDTTSPSSGEESFGTKTWFHQGEMSFIGGNDASESTASLSLAFINGLRISNHFAAGAGIGWDRYDQMNVFPLFARFLGLLKPEGHTPFAFIDGGYGWVRERKTPELLEVTNAAGGLMLQAGAGYMFEGPSGWRISIHAAYKIQKSEMEYRYADIDWWNEPLEATWSEERTRKRFVAGISFLF